MLVYWVPLEKQVLILDTPTVHVQRQRLVAIFTVVTVIIVATKTATDQCINADG